MRRILSVFVSVLVLSGAAYGFDYASSTGTFNVGTAVVNDWSAFSWKWSGRDYRSLSVTFTGLSTPSTVSNVYLRLSAREKGPYSLQVSGGTVTPGTTSIVWAIATPLPPTNIPPDDLYYAEFQGVSSSGETRSFAKGKIRVDWSLYSITNTASWTPINVTYSGTGTVSITELDPVFTAASNKYWTGIAFASNSIAPLQTATNALNANSTNHTAQIATLQTATGALNTAVGALQTATNVLNAAVTNHTAQISALQSTNAVFEPRIGSNEAFRVAQNNTNIGFNARIGSNEAFNTAQANTNIGFNARIGSNEAFNTAQANTNINHENRIVSNETFRTTTQPATNLALQNQITVNLANQNATNVVFQSFDTAQNNTNSGFQALHTAQADTNTVFRNLFTAQGNTNAGFESRIVAREAYDTAQSSTNTVFRNLFIALANTNAVFEPRIVEGETAYGWNNHALAGYLTTTTNIFTVLYSADRSKLGANLSGLTQGVYTGSLTSVSYTGVTVMVVGRTYLMGYTKIGANGTSTLSIASQSLLATAAGSTSNYFTYSGTDTNLILKLDGNGLSLCNVSNLYVKQITNGNINAAGDVNVGGTMYVDGIPMTNAAPHIALTTSAHGGVFTNWLATNTYVKIESDPIHTNWLATNTYEKLGGMFTNWLATNTYVKTETDPVFTNWVSTNQDLIHTNDAAYLAALTNGVLSQGNVNSYSVTGRMQYVMINTNYDAAGAAAGVTLTTLGAAPTNDSRITLGAGWASTNYDVSGAAAGVSSAIMPQVSGMLTGKVDRVDTNAWTVTAHQAWITNYVETDSIATGQVAALSNQVQGITNGAALGVTAVQRTGDTMTGTLYLPTASTASNAATRYDQVSALLLAAIPMYLTTNLETIATNDFQYPLKVFKSSTDFPATVGTCSVTYATLNDYPIAMIYTNQGFTSLQAGKALFSWWCNENTAGSASHKAEVYIWDTVRKVLVEIGEGGPTLPVPSGASAVSQSAEIPYNAVPETNLFYMAGRMKVMVLSGTPTVNFKTGPGFPCSFSFQLPNRALTEGFYQRAGDQLTGPMDANGNIITNGIFAGDGSSLTGITAAQVGAATTAQMAEVQGRTNVWNQAATDGTSATGAIAVIQSSTSKWNTASTDASSATGAVATLQASTSKWNTASADASAATNDIVALKSATNSLDTRVTLVTTQLFTGAGITGRVTSAAGDAGKYLKADGTWATPAGAGDFKADGSVAMTGNLNFGGKEGTNTTLLSAGTGTFANVLTLGGNTVLTNMTFGATDSTAYRGDWGASVSQQVAVLNTNAYPMQSGIASSNLAYIASTNAEAARGIATNAQAVANAALPKAGGTMTGIIFYGTNRLYLGTDTNAPWVVGLGTTNIQFGAGTNRAIFGSPW